MAWVALAITAAIDWSNVIVALIAAIAGITNTILIHLFRRGQAEIMRGQYDVKKKIGAANRDRDTVE